MKSTKTSNDLEEITYFFIVLTSDLLCSAAVSRPVYAAR